MADSTPALINLQQPILLVDDDHDFRRELALFLRHRGDEVVEAENGRDALDYLVANESREPGLIVLDLQMPVMSGWELLAIVKSYHRLGGIPIIVVSGNEVPSIALKHGAIAEYVRKPIDAHSLTQLIERHRRR
jgi:CheY-like chemotaxis protein